jgi:hypothetical protein
VSINYIKKLISLSNQIVDEIPSFDVIHPKELIPYGLKPHTRSISWLAESVVCQNIKKNITKYSLSFFEEPQTDIGVWDFKLKFKDFGDLIYVNFKVTNVEANRQHNDMSSIKKLINFFQDDKKKNLFYLIFPIKFENNKINFVKNFKCGEYIKMKDFYLNPRNEHIQAYYDVVSVDRTYDEFLSILMDKQRKGKKIFIKE